MKIICIGRNYVKHAQELNSEVPTEPVIFLKPESSLLRKNHPFFYPEFSENIHYETELVYKINKVGRHIQKQFAHTYYDEIGLGIDLTARDLQNKLKDKGLPWELSKAFDFSAPISKFISKTKFSEQNGISFLLKINGEIRQQGNSKNMIFSIDDLIVYISKFFTLKIGDLIFTGTPEGVGPVKIGDNLQAFLEGEKMLDFKIL
ncbi:MAG: fumarylacetoacetate hydrolase family protein [Bacteroidales bacterium]|nr:fumarylacetoacetate hydrolase family protein [Bacteroidales bacterium]